MKAVSLISAFIKGTLVLTLSNVMSKNRSSVFRAVGSYYFPFLFFPIFGILFMHGSLSGESFVREQSLNGTFIVESFEKEQSQKWINFLEELRAKAALKLGLQGLSDHRLLVRISPDSESLDRVRFYAKVSHGKLDFYLKIVDLTERPELLRALSRVFIYERILPPGKEWKSGEVLPEIPFWMLEGLAQSLDPSILNLETIDQIIRRMEQVNKFPTLKQVISWNELSPHKLDAYFQRSFCYALFAWNFLGDSHADKRWSLFSEDLNRWIIGNEEEMEGRWILFLKHFRAKKEFFMSWEQTERAVEKLFVFQIPVQMTEGAEMQFVQWDALEGHQKSQVFLNEISQRKEELLLLEAQAHFAWRAFLFYYRTALQFLSNELEAKVEMKSHYSSRKVNSTSLSASLNKATYQEMIKVAKQELSGIKIRSEKTTEYLDWFLVNHSSQQESFKFEEYYQEAIKKKSTPLKENDLYHVKGIRTEMLNEEW